MKRIILLFVLLASAICASATSVDYHFSYSMQAGSVFGTLSTIDEGGSVYQVIDAQGSYLGVPITGVFDPSQSGNVFLFDEILYYPAPPYVNLGGIVFELNGNTDIATAINLYWDGAGYRSIDGGNNGPYVQLSITPADQELPSPEPGTIALLGSGVLGLGGLLRRQLQMWQC